MSKIKFDSEYEDIKIGFRTYTLHYQLDGTYCAVYGMKPNYSYGLVTHYKHTRLNEIINDLRERVIDY